jgi:hypothetical protein
MHTSQDLTINVDGYMYYNWHVWNNDVAKTHEFMAGASSLIDCQLASYSSNSVNISQIFSLHFTIPVPAFANASVEIFRVHCNTHYTFGEDGTFWSK